MDFEEKIPTFAGIWWIVTIILKVFLVISAIY